ncbi:P-loop NTPase fold protein [Marinomonas arenicola]|uniref:KAP family P-loop NTPase fold protein n=1 Tax=Marinomonas arenicola TaxID=569601 RepID=UPI00311FC2CB
MPTNQPFTNEEKAHLKVRLNKLNDESIFIFSSRCALSVFPFIFAENSLNHKNKSGLGFWKKPKQGIYLLSVWRALLVSYTNNKSLDINHKAIANNASLTASSSLDSSRGDFISETSNYAAYSAAYSVLSLLSPKLDYPLDTAIAALNSANHYHPNYVEEIKNRILNDLENLEQNIHIKETPLWLETKDSKYVELVKRYITPKKLKDLSNKIRAVDIKAAEITEKIQYIYLGIFNAKPDKKAIENALDQLKEYFSNKSIEEKENNNILYGKEDKAFYGENDGLFYKKENETNSENELKKTEYDIETIAGNRHSSHQYAVEDKLNRQHLVNTLAALLQNKNNHHHQTIGLLGHWGVGKTSVVELLKNTLQMKQQTDEPDFLFAEFNAWEYEHTDNLQAGIAQEMIKALSSPEPKPVCWEKACWPFRKLWLTLKFAWSLLRWKILTPLFPLVFALAPIWFLYFFNEPFRQINESIIYIFSTTWFIGFLYPTWKEVKKVLAGPLAKEFLTYLKLPDYGEYLGTIPVMREHIKKLTKVRLANEKRLLYVVDDLDRCGHKGIVKVLEAVRMVLDLDNVIVVIAVDQRIALAALALNYKELATQHHIEDPRLIARDYLAKIIHLPIVLTEPDEVSVSGYLEHLWEQTSSPESNTPNERDDNPNKDTADNNDETSLIEGVEQEEKTTQRANAPFPNTVLLSTDATETDSQIEEATEHKQPVEQLTKLQKQAFKFWIRHFELSNPRQIKRLNNSFNLLRNFYSEDEISDKITTEEGGTEHAFPMMVTLFAFEYLNNLDGMQERHSLKKLIKKEKADSKDANNEYPTGHKITPLVIELANLSLENTTMIQGIEPFVLPGIDMIDKNFAEKAESFEAGRCR